MVANNGQLDADSRQVAEYKACGHGDIVDWDGFSGVIERVQAIGDLGAIRKGLHDGGHLKVAAPGIGDKAGDGVNQLHQGLEGVFSRVVTDATGQNGAGLTADDGGLAALQLRLTSIALMESRGETPDLERIRKVWSEIAKHPDQKLSGETIANLMKIFKEADKLQGEAGKYPLTDSLIKLVVETSGAALAKQAPSPIRRWLTQSLYTGYHNGFHAQYPLMITHGDKPEVDVALASLDLFANHPEAGGQHRKMLAEKYATSIKSLFDGANPHTSREDLAATPSYGRRDITLLGKASDIYLKLSSIACGGA